MTSIFLASAISCFALQQRDLAHLREVHAHRIVDAPAVVLVEEADVESRRGLVVGFGPSRCSPLRAPRPRTRRSARCPALPGASRSWSSFSGLTASSGKYSLTWRRSGSLFLARFEERLEAVVQFQVHATLHHEAGGRSPRKSGSGEPNHRPESTRTEPAVAIDGPSMAQIGGVANRCCNRRNRSTAAS